ncbi:hypothetical protein ACQKWADRAFT_283805 [Trichoderma austrokoningii]
MIEKPGAHWLAGGWARYSIRHGSRPESHWSADITPQILGSCSKNLASKAATRGQMTAHDPLHMQWWHRTDQRSRYEAFAELDASPGDSFLLLSPASPPSRPVNGTVGVALDPCLMSS